MDEGRANPKRRPKGLRLTNRAWKYPALLDAVRKLIQEKTWLGTVESIAWELRAKRSMVKKAMYQMVREGHMHAPRNHRPWSGWIASYWPRREKEE